MAFVEKGLTTKMLMDYEKILAKVSNYQKLYNSIDIFPQHAHVCNFKELF